MDIVQQPAIVQLQTSSSSIKYRLLSQNFNLTYRSIVQFPLCLSYITVCLSVLECWGGVRVVSVHPNAANTQSEIGPPRHSLSGPISSFLSLIKVTPFETLVFLG